jgi:AbrB family looped-hinge helix DNA binding protein
MSVRATRLTSKGQVVIPKEIRDRTGLAIGDSLSLTSDEDGGRVVKRSGWARETAGCLPSRRNPIEPADLEELLEQIADRDVLNKYGKAN